MLETPLIEEVEKLIDKMGWLNVEESLIYMGIFDNYRY